VYVLAGTGYPNKNKSVGNGRSTARKENKRANKYRSVAVIL
jgi:hypothetical protein